MPSKLVEELNSLEELNYYTLNTLVERFKADKDYYEPEQDRNDYEGDHDILHDHGRTKTVNYKDEKGTDQTKKVELNKLVFNFQQKIVETALAFLFGDNATIERNGEVDEEVFSNFKKVWDNIKMDFNIEECVRDCMIETKSAILFYLTRDDEAQSLQPFGHDEVSLRMKVLSHDKGDEIYPYFDNNGKMDAFAREFSVPDVDSEQYTFNEPQLIRKTEIYTEDYIYHIWKKNDTVWKAKREENKIRKIPVVYFDKKYPEWHVVNSLINRVELMKSKHGDSNDYFAFPALIVKGKVHNLPGKEEVGKLYEVEGVTREDGSKEYPGGVETLTWDQSPESIKNEYQELVNSIYTMTYTPDISFENLKGIGNVSGIALKLMFLDAKIKARNNKVLFGEKIDRVISLMKAFIEYASVGNTGIRELNVSYRFDDIIPESESDLIENLITSTGGKPIMSQKTAMQKHPFVNDAEQEQSNLDEEESKQQNILGGQTGGTFNP